MQLTDSPERFSLIKTCDYIEMCWLDDNHNSKLPHGKDPNTVLDGLMGICLNMLPFRSIEVKMEM